MPGLPARQSKNKKKGGCVVGRGCSGGRGVGPQHTCRKGPQRGHGPSEGEGQAKARRWGRFLGCRVTTAGAVYGGGVAQGQGQHQRTWGNSRQIVFTRLVKTASVETLELPAVVAEFESTA